MEQGRRKIFIVGSGNESEYKQSIQYVSYPRDGCSRYISVATHRKKRYSIGDGMYVGPGYFKPEKVKDDTYSMASAANGMQCFLNN